jgi:hypothetical protein
VVAPALALHHTGKQTKIRNDAPASQHFHGGQRRGEERRGQAEPERLVANPSESLHGFDGGFFVDVKKKRRCNEVPVLDL